MKVFRSIIVWCALVTLLVSRHQALAWTCDNGNGTFTNPVLYADYPDPDIIRVGSDFYMVSSTFVSTPGLEVLHSKDLINWDIAGYAAQTLTGSPLFNMEGGARYGGGIWAPSLRYHKGAFYLLVNQEPGGLYLYRASCPAGPWTASKIDAYMFDPSLLFDEDGTAYIVHGTGGRIAVAKLDPEMKTVLSSTVIPTEKGSEGSHAYKINGTYYIFNSTYGPSPKLLCYRSQNLFGPYEEVVICDNHIPWGGPHQGGIVDLPDGSWYAFSLADTGPIGRVVWMGPVTWKDGWPFFGDPANPSIPAVNKKPVVGSFAVTHLPASDEFNTPALSSQWQWNHNPVDGAWSLSSRPGWLRLQSQTAPNMAMARNTLTQRTEGPACTGTIKVDVSHLQNGDRAGFCLLELHYGYIGVVKKSDGFDIVRVINSGTLKSPIEDTTDSVRDLHGKDVWLRIQCDFKRNTATFLCSTDSVNFSPLGGDFPMHFTLNTFQGERFGIFSHNASPSQGYLDVDYFHEQF